MDARMAQNGAVNGGVRAIPVNPYEANVPNGDAPDAPMMADGQPAEEPNAITARSVALAEIDAIGFSSFHWKIIAVSGVGFFTGKIMIELVYDDGYDALVDLGIKIASPLGNLVGQLVFGWLADRYGRKKMYLWVLVIIIFSTFAQALAGKGASVRLTGALIVWRFCMGVGIGGDYPLSAVIAAEFAPIQVRGRMMTAVFAMQGFGYLAAAIVAVVVVTAYRSSISSAGSDSFNSSSVDDCWRLLIGLGCIPGILALYVRVTVPETPRWTMDVKRNVERAVHDVELFLNRAPPGPVPPRRHNWTLPHLSSDGFIAYLSMSRWANGRILLGTAYSWFAADLAFYGLSFNSSIVLYSLFFQQQCPPAYAILFNASVANLLLSLCGLIPGYWVCCLLIDYWGRKPIQYMGFALLTIIFICMAASFEILQMPPLSGSPYSNCASSSIPTSTYSHPTMGPAWVALWCCANFFLNFGPNTTTFIIPAEAFATRHRATAHGVSAACGKIGAIIAQILVYKLGGEPQSYRVLLWIFAVVMASGILSTILVPETKNEALETLAHETEVVPMVVRLPTDRDGFVARDPQPGK